MASAQPISGTLFICGGGKIPDDALAHFVELAGGHKAHLVVITTASETAETSEVDSRLEFWRRQKLSELTILHTRDRHVADDPNFTAPLETATGVWFIGGHQQRVTDAYLGTRTETAIKGVLERGGVVGGTSAGAAIMSQLMITGGTPDHPELGYGLGFLPGTLVDQHFLKRKREKRLLHALSEYPKLVGVGIDENTALIVQGRKFSVRGESGVVVYLPPVGGKPPVARTLLEGMEADLLALHRAVQSRIHPKYQFDDAHPKPEGPSGTLVVVGGGEIPDEAAEKFVEAAGGPQALIVVVTTALGDKPDSESRAIAWLTEAGAKQVRFVHPQTRAEAEDPALLALLQKAGGLWFTGGRQWRLVDVFDGTAAEKAFHAVLTRGGAIGGNGGGASILSDYLVRGNPLSNKEIMAPGYEDGFGFLKGVAIDPFFTQRNRFSDMARLKREYPNLVGVGIDEETALVIKEGQIDVVGKNHVVVYDRDQPDEADERFEFLFGGDRYDLARRSRMGPPRDDQAAPRVAVAEPANDDADPEPQPPLACDE
ncbi:MAG: cyanophycinase [Planctomycetes bacterium]|nr:cyanophycinase [Planctomycetota bacterium]